MPSSRCWMRTVCVPADEKYTLPESPQYVVSSQPQPESPAPLHASSEYVSALAVPMRPSGAPAASTAPENCTNIESFTYVLFSAAARIHK